jgi:DNA polymerase I-like protein with 3'-5' exonuclease and polymerase domains
MAELLTSLGVDPPTKISPATQQETYAFAKTDEEFKALLDHDDPLVQALVAARMGHKSTLEETRTERFINISRLHFPHYGENLFPIALKVAGAHTHRLSGDWRLNQQNLARPSRKRPRAMLRESIVTPEGYTIVAGDESQIEARVNAVFCGQWDLVDVFAKGGDPYSLQDPHSQRRLRCGLGEVPSLDPPSVRRAAR